MAVHHPGLEFALVASIAAAGSYLFTPLARRVAIFWGAVARPRDRDVHAVATPRMGGVALLLGFVMAIFVAARLPALRGSFSNGPEITWVLVSGAIICAIGVLDDRFELDSLTKLAGQVLATGIMVTKGGVQLADFYLPGYGTVSLGRDLAIPVTILLTVLTINAVNFIDGLDGLAAGVTAIGASAFFAFSYYLARHGYLNVAAAPTLLTAALAGTCIGFLPHNFSPARIFMGDSGSMLVGLILSAGATTATTNADPQAFSGVGSLPLALPLLIPIAVLAVPFVDLVLAVIRRVARGQSPFAPDKQHLHHRLLELGHSHRRAVLLLYFWSALLALGGVAVSIYRGPWAIVVVVLVGAVGGVFSLVPGLRARRATPAVPPGTLPAVPPAGGRIADRVKP
ncbi:MAG: UDP-GlcNAc:undecaprenyl-phosphate/decaprenyl-phosphate GlcNAc-phosphate transferase [Pseudonocardiales bacterium]|jgi:UDP-GlcNAc:undecaprenyl-phosphate GlcNAc-1-phosphate transferase|nr:UDP-GlcNAc:undecaprenyl-phosphate/decaprenyl-phosphate GlcNAc-phosphate transferase [Pseudonocardiales bacterium]